VKIKPSALLPPLVAIVILVLTLQYTRGALQASGAWRTEPRIPRITSEDPYLRIDRILARPKFATSAVSPRNPFAYGVAPQPVVVNRGGGTTRPTPRPALPRPQLTAILWDADPRAMIRYDGRDYTVRENSLFAEFRVASITKTNVTLERNGSPIVLSLRPRGE
jgi:hypothetical protein